MKTLIKSAFVLGLTLSLIPSLSLACEEGSIQVSHLGVNYTCDTSIPELGEAWHDSRGLLWGDRVSEVMNHEEAKTYCEALDARLPTMKEWKTLSDDHHQLPNLVGRWYWSSDLLFDNFFATLVRFSFDQSKIDSLLTPPQNLGNVRCVKSIGVHYKEYPKTPTILFEGETLDFYSQNDLYGEFSNFAAFPIFMDGEWWPTSEHYFQAQKYLNPELKAWVQAAPNAMEAAHRGRDVNVPKRPDWFEVRDLVMERALWEKFTRYPELKTLLLSTGSSRIYEHTKNDCYWGDCEDRTGKNQLGNLLMKIRESLTGL